MYRRNIQLNRLGVRVCGRHSWGAVGSTVAFVQKTMLMNLFKPFRGHYNRCVNQGEHLQMMHALLLITIKAVYCDASTIWIRQVSPFISKGIWITVMQQSWTKQKLATFLKVVFLFTLINGYKDNRIFKFKWASSKLGGTEVVENLSKPKEQWYVIIQSVSIMGLRSWTAIINTFRFLSV